MDFLAERQMLVKILRAEGIQSASVLEAIENTPREKFVPVDLQNRAYENNALPIGSDQTISQPYIVALMSEALQLTGEETVLELGTGSGYQAAVLSQLAKRVISLERLPELVETASRRLQELGYSNVECFEADGTLGWPDEAPFDGIIVTAASPKVPPPLFNQLKDGGLIVIPTGPRDIQTLYVYERRGDKYLKQDLCGCRFVKLIGKEGWFPTKFSDE